MELVPLKTVHGEAKAWETIAGLDAAEVCRNASAGFDAGVYRVRSFGIEFDLRTAEREIVCADPRGALFLGDLKDLFRLSLLWYLTSARDIPATGRLIRPVDARGGQRFSAGTHLLPLDPIARRFASDREGFYARGERYGAERAPGFGDAGVRLHPLPRVPVTMALWMPDEEEDFPPRVDMFFDSTVDFQISLSDITWSVALMAALVMQV